MHGYSRIRGSRSVDYDESKWKDCSTDLKCSSINGSAKWAFNCNSRDQINGCKEQDFVKDSETMDPSGQAGFILGRALSLRESMKDKRFMKKTHGGDSVVKDSSNKSLQGAVKRVFSTRKSAPEQDKLYPHADFLSADVGFKRSESLRYNRIGSPPPFDLDADGSVLKKKKKSVLKTCKRLLGMQRN
ncbi:hypothetical protein SUGI_0294770 [Cryptomeria japonica]|nr:hypothetical protein SUGI_0294770 [Cryptomeria japonica]